MKKILLLIAMSGMCFMILTGCNSSSSEAGETEDVAESTATQTQSEDTSANLEVYDSGVLSAVVPEGWTGLHAQDALGEYEDLPGDPYLIYISKGNDDVVFIDYYPKVAIYYSDEETLINTASDRMFFDSYEELAPIQTSHYTWEGFQGTVDSTVYAEYYTLAGTGSIYLSVQLVSEDGGNITLEDEDVQAIIESVMLTIE